MVLDCELDKAMTKTSLIFPFLLLLTFSGVSSAEEGMNCHVTFYQTKDMGCIDVVVKGLSKLGGNHQNAETDPGLVGFFAEVFSTYPQEKVRLLGQDVSREAQTVFIKALYEANLQDEAQTYANASGFAALYKSVQDTGVAPLNQLKPFAVAGHNDVLIGAYFASGKTQYIRRILDNFLDADDGMVGDSLRMAMMNGKFGPNLAAPGREKTIIRAACEKYECKNDMRKLKRTMTLSSAFWALRSLSRQDAAIKKTLVEFFDGNPRLMQTLLTENNAFSNYVTTLVAYAAIKDNPKIEASLSIYEKLGSAKEAMNAMLLFMKN
jgi:hypothetical protein